MKGQPQFGQGALPSHGMGRRWLLSMRRPVSRLDGITVCGAGIFSDSNASRVRERVLERVPEPDRRRRCRWYVVRQLRHHRWPGIRSEAWHFEQSIQHLYNTPRRLKAV
jgi:hypothetical protein